MSLSRGLGGGGRVIDVTKQNCGCQGYAHFYQMTTGILLCPGDLSKTSSGFGAYVFVI